MTNHPPVLWHCWLGHQTCKNRRPYNLYCVGADVKPCSINQSIRFTGTFTWVLHDIWHISSFALHSPSINSWPRVLRSCGTVGWLFIWSVLCFADINVLCCCFCMMLKTVGHITYIVLVQTLNHAQSISLLKTCSGCLCNPLMRILREKTVYIMWK